MNTLRPFIYKLVNTRETLQTEVTLNETSRFSFEDKLVLSLKLDLYDHHSYNFYELFELPTPYSNPGFAAIQPRARYLASDPSRRDHIFISTEELSKCQSTQGRRYCNYTPDARTDDSCEKVLTRYPSADTPDDCRKRLFPGPSWFQRRSENNWLFSTHEVQLHIHCPPLKKIFTLRGSGTLKIRPDCEIAEATEYHYQWLLALPPITIVVSISILAGTLLIRRKRIQPVTNSVDPDDDLPVNPPTTRLNTPSYSEPMPRHYLPIPLLISSYSSRECANTRKHITPPPSKQESYVYDRPPSPRPILPERNPHKVTSPSN